MLYRRIKRERPVSYFVTIVLAYLHGYARLLLDGVGGSSLARAVYEFVTRSSLAALSPPAQGCLIVMLVEVAGMMFIARGTFLGSMISWQCLYAAIFIIALSLALHLTSVSLAEYIV